MVPQTKTFEGQLVSNNAPFPLLCSCFQVVHQRVLLLLYLSRRGVLYNTGQASWSKYQKADSLSNTHSMNFSSFPS